MATLVLYFTRTGNTEYVAELIAKELKADLEQIQEHKDRSGWFGFATAIFDAIRKGRSKIDSLQRRPSAFDRIIIGQPVWASLPVPAVREFAKHYPLAGKELALFCTMDGTSPGDCLTETAKLFPGAKTVLTRAFVRPRADEEKTKKDVRKFCERLLA